MRISYLAVSASPKSETHTNGLDEKTNHNIKRAVMKLVNDQQNNWDTFLDATLFSLRSKVHTSTKHTPFQLMYGREAVFPSEVPVDFPLSIVLPDEDDINKFKKGHSRGHIGCQMKSLMLIFMCWWTKKRNLFAISLQW
uniref:Integrase catalytic domain-containing protein n=1 Tax=Knipowitschia caucasica TaxID=637954 RepID=A0AAV2IWE8_KNICA